MRIHQNVTGDKILYISKYQMMSAHRSITAQTDKGDGCPIRYGHKIPLYKANGL
jgi:hypothetical protein